MAQPALRFQPYPDGDGWRWRALLRNGRISCDSKELYRSKRHADRAIESFKKAAQATVCTLDAP